MPHWCMQTWPSFFHLFTDFRNWKYTGLRKNIDKEGQKYNIIFINKVSKPVVVYGLHAKTVKRTG